MGEATRHDGPVVAPAGDGTEAREAARARLAGRLPVLAGIAIAATLAISTSSAALLWMARHGGGTGGPASAASDTDNTPIPAPVATGAATVEACVPHGMAVTLTDGTRECSWDGTGLDCSGGLDARLVGDDGRRATVEVTLGDAAGSVIATVGRTEGEGSDGGDGRAGGLPVSMSATMATADGGTLSVAGDAWGMAGGGTVAVAPAAMRFGAARDAGSGGGTDDGKTDEAAGGKGDKDDGREGSGKADGKAGGEVDEQADGEASGKGDGKRDEAAGEKGSGEGPADGRSPQPLTLGTRVTYVVGAGDAAHCGSAVFCTATLSAGAGTTEAYLTTTTRSSSTDSPHGLAAGTVLSVGRRTDRPGREAVSECSRVAVAPGAKVCESGYAG